MRALVKSRREPGLWMEDVVKPTVGPNDVLVKVQKTGICGTDIHIYNWDEWSQKTINTPMHIGHEFMGVVAEVGSEVTGFKIKEESGFWIESPKQRSFADTGFSEDAAFDSSRFF